MNETGAVVVWGGDQSLPTMAVVAVVWSSAVICDTTTQGGAVGGGSSRSRRGVIAASSGHRLCKMIRRGRFLLCRVFAVFIVPFFASHFYAARTF